MTSHIATVYQNGPTASGYGEILLRRQAFRVGQLDVYDVPHFCPEDPTVQTDPAIVAFGERLGLRITGKRYLGDLALTATDVIAFYGIELMQVPSLARRWRLVDLLGRGEDSLLGQITLGPYANKLRLALQNDELPSLRQSAV